MRKVGNIRDMQGGMRKIGNIRDMQRIDKRQNFERNLSNAQSEAAKYEEEARKASSPLGMAWNTAKGVIPFAGDTYTKLGSQVLRHPVRTAGAVATGLYEGAVKPVLQLATPKKYEGIYDIGMKSQNDVEDAIRGGFKFSGAVAPYSAVTKGVQMASNLDKVAKIAPWLQRSALAQNFAGNLIGGQLLTEEEGLKGRAKQAALDSVLFGLTNVRGIKNAVNSRLANRSTGSALPLDKSPLSVDSTTTPQAQGRSRLLPQQPGQSAIVSPGNRQVSSFPGNSTTLAEMQKVGPAKRGLISTIQNSPEYSDDMGKKLADIPGYEVRGQEQIVKGAQRLIATNINEAERIATTEASDRATILSDELLKHYDDIAQRAKAAGNQELFEKALDRSRALALQTDVNLRESGRAISAANRFNKQSPEGMLRTLNEIAEQKGAKLQLTNSQIFDFQRRAQEISQILDPRQRALKTFELMDDVYENIPFGTKDKLYQALGLPRAIMATADLSAPLRQGIFTMARHPILFAKNFGKMFKYAFSEDAYKNLKADIVTSPNYGLYVKHKLPITDLGAGLNAREEQFMSNLAEKIPLFGNLAKGSNRAYAGFLNKMRMDLFDDFIKTAELNGIKDEKFLADAARFVGAATGRGNIHQLFGGDASGKIWASFFFSPRLMASRMSLLNPMYYMSLHPSVRKEALKSLAAFVGTGSGILALAQANGAEVGTDPRSADFGKIKVGDTRFDTWGGFQQYARLIGQLITGEKISTTTGRQTELGSGGYGAPTHESIIMDFFKSKEAPVLSFLTRAFQGEQYGEPFRLGPEILDRFIPMIISDAYDLQKEWGGAGLLMAVPSAFGVGSQTYGDQIPMMDKTATGRPSIEWRQQPGLGETIYNTITGKEVSDIPEQYRKPLYDERRTEQLRKVDVDSAKMRVLQTGKPEQVGDTFVYLENGVVKTKKYGKASRTPLRDRIIDEVTRMKQPQPYYPITQ